MHANVRHELLFVLLLPSVRPVPCTCRIHRSKWAFPKDAVSNPADADGADGADGADADYGAADADNAGSDVHDAGSRRRWPLARASSDAAAPARRLGCIARACVPSALHNKEQFACSVPTYWPYSVGWALMAARMSGRALGLNWGFSWGSLERGRGGSEECGMRVPVQDACMLFKLRGRDAATLLTDENVKMEPACWWIGKAGVLVDR
eukprot:409024-Pleurochrysis_carterae.AAC.1